MSESANGQECLLWLLAPENAGYWLLLPQKPRGLLFRESGRGTSSLLSPFSSLPPWVLGAMCLAYTQQHYLDPCVSTSDLHAQ